MTAKEVVLGYWQAMQSNDFSQVAKWLADDFECHWQQSNERIVGRENFIAVNRAYPSQGLWQFVLKRLVVEGDTVVTEVNVTDGKTLAKAITFHYVIKGFISRQVEYWVDDYAAPEWRKQWVERLNNYE